DLTELSHSAAFWVDAIVGTGVVGTPSGRERVGIQFLQQRPRKNILALDCPSGLNASTGAAECAVVAGMTLTFIAYKAGLVTGAGPGLTGVLQIDYLGVTVSSANAVAHTLTAAHLQWPSRPADSHKGACGQVYVVGGSRGMVGAGILTAEAALVTGSGLVTAHIDHTGHAPLMARCPEIMTAEARLPDALGAIGVAAIGPGLGRDNAARQCWATFVERFEAAANPWVVDADALWHLANAPMRRSSWVLTPHPGEAARLLSCTIADVQADRLVASRELQRRYGGVIVLKGAGNVVATADGCAVLAVSLGAMATGGLGDALTGVIAALLAQGMAPELAAKSGLVALITAARTVAQRQPVARASSVVAQLPHTLYDLGFHADVQAIREGDQNERAEWMSG
ncbi:MAG: NAD(P)H-hydrate dehydratase, partial [Natronospirillum sp.]